MGTDVNISNIYEEMITRTEIIDEGFQNTDKLVRFIVEATIDMHINQNDIEQVYTYDNYKEDISNGVSEHAMINKLKDITESVATIKINELNQTIPSMSIQLKTFPNMKKAQLYRFSFEELLAKYNEQYNIEQTQNIANVTQPIEK